MGQFASAAFEVFEELRTVVGVCVCHWTFLEETLRDSISNKSSIVIRLVSFVVVERWSRCTDLQSIIGDIFVARKPDGNGMACGMVADSESRWGGVGDKSFLIMCVHKHAHARVSPSFLCI